MRASKKKTTQKCHNSAIKTERHGNEQSIRNFWVNGTQSRFEREKRRSTMKIIEKKKRRIEEEYIKN